MNADSLAGLIAASYPRPNDTFARALWAENAADTCGILAKRYRQEETTLIRTIQNHGLTSDRYAVTEQYRPYATVNIPLLQQKMPDVYTACVHIRNADAVKILGRERVYQLAAAELGDAIHDYEVVTVTDVMRLLPAAEAACYIVDGTEFVKYAVVKKDV